MRRDAYCSNLLPSKLSYAYFSISDGTTLVIALSSSSSSSDINLQ